MVECAARTRNHWWNFQEGKCTTQTQTFCQNPLFSVKSFGEWQQGIPEDSTRVPGTFRKLWVQSLLFLHPSGFTLHRSLHTHIAWTHKQDPVCHIFIWQQANSFVFSRWDNSDLGCQAGEGHGHGRKTPPRTRICCQFCRLLTWWQVCCFKLIWHDSPSAIPDFGSNLAITSVSYTIAAYSAAIPRHTSIPHIPLCNIPHLAKYGIYLINFTATTTTIITSDTHMHWNVANRASPPMPNTASRKDDRNSLQIGQTQRIHKTVQARA